MADIVGATLQAMMWLFFAAIGIIICLILYLKSKYKILIMYKDFTNGGRWVFDKAKNHTSKDDNTNMWKLEKAKKLIIPTPETTYNNEKGRPVGLFYRFDEDNFVPIKDDTKIEDIKNDKTFMNKFDPFPTAHKSIYMQQMKKNERWKKKGLSEMLKDAFPYVAIILLVALNLILIPDVLESKAVASNQATEAGRAWEDAANAWDEIINDKEIIRADQSAPKVKDSDKNKDPPN